MYYIRYSIAPQTGDSKLMQILSLFPLQLKKQFMYKLLYDKHLINKKLNSVAYPNVLLGKLRFNSWE